MHDRKGRALKVGDVVLIPARITSLSVSTPDYCNVTAQSVYGRRPDDLPETFCINTGVMLRANPDDENDLTELDPGRPVPAHGSGP